MVTDILTGINELNSALNIKVKVHMRNNATLSDELCIELIKNRLKSSKSYYGFVMDNFPTTRRQAELLMKANVRIHNFIDLNIDIAKIIDMFNNKSNNYMKDYIETQFDKEKTGEEEEEEEAEDKSKKPTTMRIADDINKMFSKDRLEFELNAQLRTYQQNKMDLLGFYNLINQSYLPIDNNCNYWGLMSKIDDNVNRILTQLIKLTFNLNYN